MPAGRLVGSSNLNSTHMPPPLPWPIVTGETTESNPTRYKLTLELCERDARSLLALCDRMNGDRQKSPRRMTDAIAAQLRSMSLPYWSHDTSIFKNHSASLTFERYPVRDVGPAFFRKAAAAEATAALARMATRKELDEENNKQIPLVPFSPS